MIHRFDYKIEMPKKPPRSCAGDALIAVVFGTAAGVVIGVDLMAQGSWWILLVPTVLIVWSTYGLVAASERCHRAYGGLEGTVAIVKELGLNDKAFLEVPRDARVVDLTAAAAESEL